MQILCPYKCQIQFMGEKNQLSPERPFIFKQVNIKNVGKCLVNTKSNEWMLISELTTIIIQGAGNSI